MKHLQQQRVAHPPRVVGGEAAHERLLLGEADDVEQRAEVAHHREAVQSREARIRMGSVHWRA